MPSSICDLVPVEERNARHIRPGLLVACTLARSAPISSAIGSDALPGTTLFGGLLGDKRVNCSGGLFVVRLEVQLSLVVHLVDKVQHVVYLGGQESDLLLDQFELSLLLVHYLRRFLGKVVQTKQAFEFFLHKINNFIIVI